MSEGLNAAIPKMRRAVPGSSFAAQDDLFPISAACEPDLLRLNNAHAVELSLLDAERLSRLLGQAFYARRVGDIDAFLLALDETATYDSPNYLWFRQRCRRFVYVDRVAVAASARGRGHARRLYADLFQRAIAAGHDTLLCEINVDPPNPASDALHAGLGFVEVGKAVIHGGIKTVRYFARPLR
jgi:predicted GNAT superfamily acetyltransferase